MEEEELKEAFLSVQNHGWKNEAGEKLATYIYKLSLPGSRSLINRYNIKKFIQCEDIAQIVTAAIIKDIDKLEFLSVYKFRGMVSAYVKIYALKEREKYSAAKRTAKFTEIISGVNDPLDRSTIVESAKVFDSSEVDLLNTYLKDIEDSGKIRLSTLLRRVLIEYPLDANQEHADALNLSLDSFNRTLNKAKSALNTVIPESDFKDYILQVLKARSYQSRPNSL